MTESWLDIGIFVFILAGISFAIWRGGQLNPESTGALGGRIIILDRDLRTVSGQQSEYGRSIKLIGERVDSIEKMSARIDDIHRLQEQQARHDLKLDDMGKTQAALLQASAEHKATSEHTARQVDRLYDFIVQKGMGA